MSYGKTAVATIFISAIVALCADDACATDIQDLVRLKGHERNVLVGMGIVIGLDGTGDSSKDSLITARPYAQLFANLGNAPASASRVRAVRFVFKQRTFNIQPI